MSSRLRRLIGAVIGWGVVVPIACLVPKRRDLIVFCGRAMDGFAGNTKYVFLHGAGPGAEKGLAVYVTTSRGLRDRLAREGYRAARYPGLRAAWTLLRARTVFLDDASWMAGSSFCFLYRATKVQLWHGMGMKKVQRQRPSIREGTRGLRTWRLGARREEVLYDVLLFNSEMQREQRANSFRFRRGLVMTHPRLDPLISAGTDEAMMIGADEEAVSRIREARSAGDAVVLFAPTHRSRGSDPFTEAALELSRLERFATDRRLHVVVKLHPKTPVPALLRDRRHERVTVYGSKSDPTPLFTLTDVLVTDYSSIYADFLVTRRPVVFFAYDLERYRTEEDRLQVDYDAATPGPKCRTQGELEYAIDEAVADGDAHRPEREAFFRRAFHDPDGRSSERLWDMAVSGEWARVRTEGPTGVRCSL